MAATEQGAYGLGSVNNIAVMHRLPRFSECPERLRVSLDLSGLTRGQEEFDCEHDGLMDTAAVFFGSGVQLIFELGRYSQRHRHTRMIL
jgi:hypothetical protein